MSKLGTKEELAEAIKMHFSNMQNGKLKLEDLELLVEQTRELYERSLVLRYKAYEEKVFGEVSHKESVSELEQTTVDEEQISESEPEMNSTEEGEDPVFDFSLFEEGEETKEESMPEEETITNDVPDKNQEEEQELSASSSDELNESSGMFSHILDSDDDSLGSKLMLSKIDTLVGVFGFNEKFQCIQELFNASSDEFNQTIDELDSLSSFVEAQSKLESIARKNNWDLDSDITAEFVRKVERRYR